MKTKTKTARHYHHGDVIEGQTEKWYCACCDGIHEGRPAPGGSDLDRLHRQVKAWKGPYRGLGLSSGGTAEVLDRPKDAENVFGEGRRGSGRRGKAKFVRDYACQRDELPML
jgi:hypothetical protein